MAETTTPVRPPDADETPPRCRLLRRHRYVRQVDERGTGVTCSRCGWGWFEPRLFVLARPPGW